MDCNEGELCNPLAFTSLWDFLQGILQAIITIGFPIIVLFIVYIGFQFIQAQGNSDKLKEVKKSFFWAVVGALIILGAQALSFAIQATVEGLGAGI
jgi:heme/copper-type cytochrome/quinol oxidase subunit 2